MSGDRQRLPAAVDVIALHGRAGLDVPTGFALLEIAIDDAFDG